MEIVRAKVPEEESLALTDRGESEAFATTEPGIKGDRGHPGFVARTSGDKRTSLEIPETHQIIFTSCQKVLSIGAPVHREKGPKVGPEDHHQTKVVPLNHPQSSVL